MHLRRMVLTLVLLGLLAAPSAQAAGRLGTPQILTSFDGESDLIGGYSVPDHGDAFAVFHRVIGRNIETVAFADDQGAIHAFDIPVTGNGFPEAVRLAALENGGGMAVWDEPSNNRVLARAWTRDGTLGETQVVLSDVTVVANGDTSTAQWRLRGDNAGTVVVATTGRSPRDPASVIAAVRDPDGSFSPQQELTPPGESGLYERPLAISPIAQDGSVTVSWGLKGSSATEGRATRIGRAPRFGDPEAANFAGDPRPLSPQNRSTVTEDGMPVTVSAEVAKLCPCNRPQIFAWAGGERVLVLGRLESDGESGTWYVAHPGSDGTFDQAEKATNNAYSRPVRRTQPGEVGFARFDTNTDYGLFQRRSRLIVIPFGPQVPRSTHAPAARFGTRGFARRGPLLVPVFCDRVCTISGSTDRHKRLAITDSLGHRIDRRQEPYSVAYLRVRSARPVERIRLRATDDAGHHAVAQARFKHRRHPDRWCLIGRSGC